MSERDPLGFVAIVAAMALAVYLTRAGGYWLIGRVPIGPRLSRMLEALPGAIIAATVAPLLAHGGVSGLAAALAALAAMLAVRNDFAAVVAGVGVAALVRAAGF
ncbi:AzlD domain-containing protein [Microbacteriaceae bacterium K1510]|nr:AzlD domain-containing protein [Microbacteriaceae bacterium K1510]